MKTVLTSTTTSVVVALVVLTASEFIRAPKDTQSRTIPETRLASKIEEAEASIADLRREIYGLLNVVNRENTSCTQCYIESKWQSEIEDIVERVSELERRLNKEITTALNKSTKKGAVANTFISVDKNESNESTVSRQYYDAENHFAEYSGIPLGDYVDSINETLHTVSNIEVSSTDCRESICRITYSKKDNLLSSFDSIDSLEIVDKLSLAVPGQPVEVRYAQDGSGSEVIYVQFR